MQIPKLKNALTTQTQLNASTAVTPISLPSPDKHSELADTWRSSRTSGSSSCSFFLPVPTLLRVPAHRPGAKNAEDSPAEETIASGQ